MIHNTADNAGIDSHRLFLEGVAKNLNLKLFGEDGMPWGTTFEELETLAVSLGQQLSREILNQALKQQAQGELPAERELCPTCQGQTEPDDPEPHIAQTTVGDAEWNEPHRHCRHCRRSFFPSVPKPGH